MCSGLPQSVSWSVLLTSRRISFILNVRKITNCFIAGVEQIFESSTQQPRQNSSSQRGDEVKNIPNWAPTNIRRQSQRFIRPGEVACRIYASMVCTSYRWPTWRWWSLNRKLLRRILGSAVGTTQARYCTYSVALRRDGATVVVLEME